MNILFLNMTRISQESMNVTTRNIAEICKHLRANGIFCTHISAISGGDKTSEFKINKILKNKEQFDWVIFVYSSFYFHVDAIRSILDIQKNTKYAWFTTEYEISDPMGSKINYDLIFSNIENNCFKTPHKHYAFLDLNSLVYIGRNHYMQKKYNMIYYGRWREDRGVYFKKYLKRSNDIILSTSKKNKLKYLLNGCDVKTFDKISWNLKKETLNLFKYSLYIEDLYTHTHYNCPASRFYESISCNAVPIFDKSCSNTILKSGIYFNEKFYYENFNDLSNDDIEIFLKNNNEYAIETKNKTLKMFESLLQTGN